MQARYRTQLPQLSGDVFITDGGMETTLIFHEGIDLPLFAAFDLLKDDEGRAALRAYYASYVELARERGVGIVLETATWRANPDWAARQGYGAEDLKRINREAVELLVELRSQYETPDTPIVISGCIGPRGDGYQPGELMSVEEARTYHSLQARAFADAGADLVTAITMTHAAEAQGIVEAARDAGLPVVISFTVETDGVLPSGEALGAAIEAVDAGTDGYAAYFMVNCAHPEHFASVLDPDAAWTKRLGGIRANASRLSHEELDEAEELDRGDPSELAELYRQIRELHPQVRVLGGCCGTDHTHIGAISDACVGTPA